MGTAEQRQPIEQRIEQTESMPGVLSQQCGNAGELRRNEARTAEARTDCEPGLIGGIEHRVSRVWVGIERDIGQVAPTEMRRKDEEGLRRRRVQLAQRLAWLAGLHARGQQLIEWHSRKNADASTSADRKGTAGDWITLQRIADRLQIIPAPDALCRDVDGHG